MHKILEAKFYDESGWANIHVEVFDHKYDYRLEDFDGIVYEGCIYNFDGDLLDLFGRIIDARALHRKD